MQIQANPFPFPSPCRSFVHRPCAPRPMDGWGAMVLAFQAREAGEALHGAWAGFLGGGASALRGVHELGRRQSMSVGDRTVSVDDAGGMSVGGRQATAVAAVAGPCGVAVGAAVSQGPGGLRLENGRLLLPDGRAIPFGNRGVIVRLPDGSQVAVGRSGDGAGAQACRWVAAGPGEEIPTSPPGATNVYDWDGAGRLTLAGSK